MKTTEWVSIVVMIGLVGLSLGMVLGVQGEQHWGNVRCAQAEYQGQAVQFCGQRLTVSLVSPGPTPSLPEIKGRP